MEEKYGDAYHEVLEVLKYIPREEYEKVPKKIIALLENYRNEKNNFRYNAGISFEEQSLSRNAKIILSILYRNCWATEEEKINIAKKEKQRLRDIELEKRKKYNTNEIFRSRDKKLIKELKENNYFIVQKKWYHKWVKKYGKKE